MILGKYLNFKNTIQKLENHNIVFSTDVEGNIWHEYANDNPLNGVYYMILNNKIMGVSSDPTLLSPIEGSDIFCLDDNNNFTIDDYFYYDDVNNELIKIENPPSLLNTKYDGTEWGIEASLEEQIEYYKNLIIQKAREHELLKVSGFIGTQEEINLRTEIEDLKQTYMDKNHELALQIENRLREV